MGQLKTAMFKVLMKVLIDRKKKPVCYYKTSFVAFVCKSKCNIIYIIICDSSFISLKLLLLYYSVT